MLKIVVIFMLLTLIGCSMNTTLTDNESKNITLNNTSLNETPKSDLGIDISLFNWFAKPTKPSALSLVLILDDIKHDYMKDAMDSYVTGRSMTEEDFSRRAVPPEIYEKLEKYNPGEKADDPVIIPDPNEDDMDDWIQIPPWKKDVPNRGSSEMICTEDGLCHMIWID